MVNIYIGIIDADLISRPKHRFPNLACMKISGYMKSQKYDVKLITDFEEIKNNNFDKIYISKVFTDTNVPEWVLQLDNVEYGGTGFFYDKADPLPDYIEHHMPDYHLYDEWVEYQLKNGGKALDYKYYTQYSIGFMARGCFRKCSFCVNKNYNKVELHSPVEEFLDKNRKYICLLDDNILGFSNWKEALESLQKTGKRFEFKQGMDIRLMTDEKARMLVESKYIGDYIFAFDNISDKDLIERKLQLWRKYDITKGQNTKLYVLCAFDRNNKYDYNFWAKDIRDTFERIKILMKYNCLPYIMRFEKYKDSPYYGMYINIASWGNQPHLFKKMSFREWCITDNKRKGGNSATIRYLEQFEKDNPYIAKEYFDLKFYELNIYGNNNNIDKILI